MAKNDIITFGQLPLISLVAGLLLSILASLFGLRLGVNSDHLAIVSDLAVDSYAQQLNIKEEQLLAQLAGLAANPRLIQTTGDGPTAARSMEEIALAELVPNTVRVRIFSVREAEIDRGATPPFSFTSLDMVNRVEAGEMVYPEAINANGRWILSVATPIKANDRIIGTLFVYIRLSALLSHLEDNVDGELKLMQRVGNAAAQELFSIGTGKADGAEGVSRQLDNPNWSINYTPSPQMTGQSIGNIILYFIPGLLFFIAGLVGLVMGSKRTARLISGDLEKLVHQITAVSVGAWSPSDGFRLNGFSGVDQKLAALGSKQAAPPPAAAETKTVAPSTQLEDEDDDIVDIEMSDGESFEEAVEKLETQESDDEPVSLPDIAEIFRAYDIRGVVDETLTDEVAHRIGQAIGSEAEARGEQTIVVGSDGRLSSPRLKDALIQGLLASGRDVVSIGSVPTPALYFTTENSDTRSGVMVTGSHNPPEYNGFKIVLDGRTLVEDEIAALYTRIQQNDLSSGEGQLTETDISDDYMDAILDDVVVAQPLKVVIDCGNGIAGDFAPELFRNLGCEVIPLYCEVDGNFPNHHPDPTIPENLEDLILTVNSQEADLGIALDGDADRVVAVTADGEIVWPDRLLMLFSKDVVSRNPGSDVVYDVKCTRHLNSVISGFGGRPIICRTGHSFIKEKIKETDAVLGGEMSGHICFGERWFGFDDGIYAAARLIEIVGAQTEGLAELLEEFPVSVSTPEILINVEEESKFDIIDQLQPLMDFEDSSITTIDGIRVDFADGWGLVRASNTSPSLTLRFEADDDGALTRIQDEFRTRLKQIRDDLDF